jgi:hypothetical protein
MMPVIKFIYGIMQTAASCNCLASGKQMRGKSTGIVHVNKRIMFKENSFIACMLMISIVFNAKADQKVPTKIQRVVATVSVASGTSTLTFEGISPDIDVQSIQVRAAGDFTILSVKYELDFLNLQTRQKKLEELMGFQAQLKSKLEIQNNSLGIYKEEENMLMKNQVVSGQNVSLDVVKLKQALEFQTARLTELKNKEQSVNSQIKLLNQEIEKYNKQVADITKGSSKATSNVLVTVSSKNAVQSQFTLTYLANNASWYPTYDVRAKNVNSPVTIAYKANVTQQSGEEWNNIKLTLSTGNPATSGSKPELAPYYLNTGMMYAGQAASITRVTGRVVGQDDGQAVVGVSVKVKGTSIGTVTDVAGNYSIQLPPGQQTLTYNFAGYESQERMVTSAVINVALKQSTNQLNEVTVMGYVTALEGRSPGVAVSNAGAADKMRIRSMSTMETKPILVQQDENQTNVEFNIDNPYTIPSDGKQYLVEINQLEIPAQYEYYTAPKLSNDVFLTAKIIDWNQYNFLSGEANLFFEGTFIGKSLIDTRATTDTLNLSLGTDKNIVVTRTLQKDQKDKQGLLGSNKKETRDWLITVKNRKSQKVDLLIDDQIPVSQNSAIVVETQELSGGKIDPLIGKVSWNLSLNPQAEKKLELKYQVRYPKNQTVIVQ